MNPLDRLEESSSSQKTEVSSKETDQLCTVKCGFCFFRVQRNKNFGSNAAGVKVRFLETLLVLNCFSSAATNSRNSQAITWRIESVSYGIRERTCAGHLGDVHITKLFLGSNSSRCFKEQRYVPDQTKNPNDETPLCI